ncbi:MAG: glutathione S-transferase family protein [Gammaproteobacteria bacterium]|nr:glutathione S-transferase family protein [Gammaproteobacteria bacterium]
MFKLYYSPGSCALAPHLALEEAGADYQAIRVDFKASEQRSPQYLQVNPKGRVPALVTPDGVLTETPAILVYIAQMFPQAALAPLGDPFRFGIAQSFNSYLCSTVHVAHAHKGRGTRWVDESDTAAIAAMQRKVPQSVAAAFELIEQQLFTGPWVLGERYSICDPYLFTLARWLEGDGIDPARFPKVAGHTARMVERPAVRKVMVAHDG